MNDANNQFKSRSEARFPMKGSRTSSLYSSRQWVEVHNCLLDWESENWQVKNDASNEYQVQMNEKHKYKQ